MHASRQCFDVLIDLGLKPPTPSNLSCELGTFNRQFLLSVVGTMLQVVRIGDADIVPCRGVWDFFKVTGG
jgi:hypothetical protein